MEVVIQGYLVANKRPTPLKNGIPGEGWWMGCLKRHPKLAPRKPQQLQMVRAKATCPVVLNHWFNQCLEPILTKLKLKQHPQQIYNVDESGFPLSWTSSMVLTRRGDKSPQALLAGTGRENVTVQTCALAAGQFLPPYIVYSGGRVMSTNTVGGPLGARYSCTPNGWMQGETFLDWFQSTFIPALPDERPVLLILDGHKSHLTYQLRVVAIEMVSIF